MAFDRFVATACSVRDDDTFCLYTLFMSEEDSRGITKVLGFSEVKVGEFG